jgi:hypothetical protein
VKPIKTKSKAKMQASMRRNSRQHSHREAPGAFEAPTSSPIKSNADTTMFHVTGVSELMDAGLDGSGVLVCVVDTGATLKCILHVRMCVCVWGGGRLGGAAAAV